MIDVMPNTCDSEVRLELFKGDLLQCQIAEMSGRWYEWAGVSDCGAGRVRTIVSGRHAFRIRTATTSAIILPMAEQDTSDTAMEHDPSSPSAILTSTGSERYKLGIRGGRLHLRCCPLLA